KIEWTTDPAGLISTTSLSSPEPMRAAKRPATSLPSMLAGTSTAAGETDSASDACTSTFGVTRLTPNVSDSAAEVFSAPAAASASAVPAGPATTADGSPSARAAVNSSLVTFFGAPSACSTRTSTSAMSVILLFLGSGGLRGTGGQMIFWPTRYLATSLPPSPS